MSKLQEDLKRIVGIKELENRLNELEQKAPITGKRAIAFERPSGTVGTAQGDRNGGGVFGANDAVLGALDGVLADDDLTDAEKAALKKAASDAAANALKNAFQTGFDKDQSLLAQDLAAGALCAADLFAAEVPSIAAASLSDAAYSVFDNTLIAMKRAALTAVECVSDCETNKPDTVRLIGDSYVPPLPPSLTPTTPAPLNDWYYGIKWPTGITNAVSGPYYTPTISQSADAIYSNVYFRGKPDLSDNMYVLISGPDNVIDELGNPGDPPGDGTHTYQYTLTLVQVDEENTEIGDRFDVNILSVPCTPDGSAVCPFTRPEVPFYFSPAGEQGGTTVRDQSTGLFYRPPEDALNSSAVDAAAHALASSTIFRCFGDENERMMKAAVNAAGGYTISEVDPLTLVEGATHRAYIMNNDNTVANIIENSGVGGAGNALMKKYVPNEMNLLAISPAGQEAGLVYTPEDP